MSKLRILAIDVDTEAMNEAFQSERPMALRFIKKLDADICDWDFTMDLYKHFARLKKQYDREENVHGKPRR